MSAFDSNNDPKILSKISTTVSARLDKNKYVQKIPNEFLDMHIYQNFLTLAERQILIKMIDAKSVPSALYIGTEREGFRTSHSCHMDPKNRSVKAINKKISDLLGIKDANSETIQGQKYDVGQQFKEHHDYFHTDQDYWKFEGTNGGQRSWTAMIYLNDDVEGGTTEFPDAAIGVRPLAGTLVAWNNMLADGTPNPKSLHAGKPVIKGTKYIITKWFRQNKWG